MRIRKGGKRAKGKDEGEDEGEDEEEGRGGLRERKGRAHT